MAGYGKVQAQHENIQFTLAMVYMRHVISMNTIRKFLSFEAYMHLCNQSDKCKQIEMKPSEAYFIRLMAVIVHMYRCAQKSTSS